MHGTVCLEQLEYENPRSRLGERGFFHIAYIDFDWRSALRIHRIMFGRLGQVGHLVHRDAAWMPVIALPAAGTFFVSCRLSNVAPTMTSISWS